MYTIQGCSVEKIAGGGIAGENV